MKQSINKITPKVNALGGHSVLAKITNLVETGSQPEQLVIAVYLLEQNKFIYCSTSFKKLLGSKIKEILEYGWDFWFLNMCPKEGLLIKNRLRTFFSEPFDQRPTSLRYHMLDANDKMIYMKHEIVFHQFHNCTMAMNYFFNITDKERIEQCLKGQNGSNAISHNDPKPISPREEEVLKLIADGYSSKQIADQLYISNHTAISHRKHLIEKFQVKNTAQLIKKASKIMEL